MERIGIAALAALAVVACNPPDRGGSASRMSGSGSDLRRTQTHTSNRITRPGAPTVTSRPGTDVGRPTGMGGGPQVRGRYGAQVGTSGTGKDRAYFY